MRSSRLLLILFSTFFHTYLVNLSFAADSFFQSRCLPNGYFADGSTYQTNLNYLLSRLSSEVINPGFYSQINGGSADQVISITGFCRGDQQQDACHICLNDIISKLQQNCSNYKEAIGWSDFYMLHYANRLISRVDPEVNPFIIRPTGTTSDDQFNQAVSSLLSWLTSQVAAGTGGSLQNYAAGDNGSGIYALVQCTLDLSSEECSSCLETAIGKMPGRTGCKGMTGCRVLLPSCNLRYETYRFIGTVPSPYSPPPPKGNPHPPPSSSSPPPPKVNPHPPPSPSSPPPPKGNPHPPPSPSSPPPAPPSPKDDVPQPSPWPSSPPPEIDVPRSSPLFPPLVKGKVGRCSWPPPLHFAVIFS
ncbi:hypothetical protein SLA2020_057630 [Shorea laevis]